MPRRKRAKRTTVKDIRTILRLTHEHGLSVRAISDRLRISKTTVATYLLRARERAYLDAASFSSISKRSCLALIQFRTIAERSRPA